MPDLRENLSNAKTNDDQGLEPLFSLEELVDAIEKITDSAVVPVRPDGWISVAEYSILKGISEQMARDRLRAGVANGVLEKKEFRDPDHPDPRRRNQPTFYYRPVKKE